jgi:hypothetical protein
MHDKSVSGLYYINLNSESVFFGELRRTSPPFFCVGRLTHFWPSFVACPACLSWLSCINRSIATTIRFVASGEITKKNVMSGIKRQGIVRQREGW